LRGQAISLYQSEKGSNKWQTDRLVTCKFGNYILELVKNCTVTLKADGSGFDFTSPGDIQNRFFTGTKWQQADVSLAIGGEDSGEFIIGSEDIVDFIKNLQPEIRYFFKHSETSTAREYSIVSQDYPILSENAVDWENVVAREKDILRLHLLKEKVGGGKIDLFRLFKGIPLPSCFRNNLGRLITLIPLEGSSMIFVSRPNYSNEEESRRNSYYVTLAGDFEVNVDKDTQSLNNLICGLSGAEYIYLPAEKQNILTFIPGQRAFAPNFTFDGTQGADTGDSDKLTDQATTAWVYVSQRDREPAAANSASSHPIYFAQPDQAVLYEAITGGNGGTGDFLDFMEVPAAALPAAQADNGHLRAFPVAPYARVKPDLIERYQKFETGMLSPLRRELIDQITASEPLLPLLPGETEASAKRVGTTPQGLVAEYSGNFETIQKLILAEYKTVVIEKDPDSQENIKKIIEKNLDFRNIGRRNSLEQENPLRAALQSSQLFLVISKPESINEYFKNDGDQSTILEIAGWKFDLDPDQWEKRQTLLIFKFHEQSIEELVSSTQAWTLPGKFNANPETIRFRLDKLIQDALARSPRDSRNSANPQDYENYRQLAFAARNPGWTGILALNVTIPQGGLPPEIAGLASGIVPEQFFAQYAGIQSSTVRVENGSLDIESSSLFGLIDYNDPAGTASDASADYNFYVSKLSVLFQNSQIKHFAGEVVVTLDKLFGEAAALQGSQPGRNEIRLAGRCETHEGRNTYTFSSGATSKFDLPDSVILNEVEIVKAQFSTDPPAKVSGFETGNTVTSRFAFWGKLDFQKQGNFDILSFGGEAGMENPEKAGMRFSNLQLISTFTWGPSTTKTFRFSAANMTFDLDKSLSRPNSLFKKFPLKLVGLLEVDGVTNTASPDSLGYMPVRTPVPGKKPESGDAWYGLVYELNLGSAGALAGKAGIVVSVLAAWKPGSGQNVYTGLRLPGSSGGKKEIPIQGILKIAFKSIEFQAQGEEDISYLLKLKNIVLKFMTLEMPPNAQTEIIIFGDPQGQDTEKTLAWYAAYAKELSPQARKQPPKSLTKA